MSYNKSKSNIEGVTKMIRKALYKVKTALDNYNYIFFDDPNKTNYDPLDIILIEKLDNCWVYMTQDHGPEVYENFIWEDWTTIVDDKMINEWLK